jgi:RNA polymerase sigma-70 factor (ECF subfamily)
VVVQQIHGPEKALAELEKIGESKILKKNHLYYAIRADLEREMGRHAEAAALLEQGLEWVSNDVERRFLEKKLAQMSHLAMNAGRA